MPPRRPTRFLLALALALPAAAGAQASATLLPTDPAHRDVARLGALGLADTVILGQRPVTRVTVARAVREAASRLDSLGDAAVAAVGREIVGRLARDTAASGTAVRRHLVETVALDGSARALAIDNGLGEVHSFVSPFLASVGGVRVADGGITAAYEPVLEIVPGSALALVVHPRASVGPVGTGRSAFESSEVRRAYLRLQLRNLSVQLGRDHLAWGQGPEVGTLFSGGGPSLDMLLIGHERPFVLPWVLRHLGPTRLSLALARLDGDQNFPHPYLATYKASILPARWLELGAHLSTKGGGEGGPPASFWDRAADATHVIDVVFRGEDDFQFSDKYAGADFRVRIPPAAGAELYGEIMLNDLDFNRFASSIGEDASHVLGLWLPRLDGAGRIDASAELRHTGIRQYRHHQFTSGHVARGRLLGDPLGPDARGAYVTVGWSRSTWTRLSAHAAAEVRSADEYADVTGGARTIDFERTLARPRERRARGVLAGETALRDGAVRLSLQGGAERTTNWAHEADATRTGAFARVGLELRPAWSGR